MTNLGQHLSLRDGTKSTAVLWQHRGNQNSQLPPSAWRPVNPVAPDFQPCPEPPVWSSIGSKVSKLAQGHREETRDHLRDACEVWTLVKTHIWTGRDAPRPGGQRECSACSQATDMSPEEL